MRLMLAVSLLILKVAGLRERQAQAAIAKAYRKANLIANAIVTARRKELAP